MFVPNPKNMPWANVSVVVFGERMCCALPAYKPDAFSCVFLTPTAAKGLLDNIYLDKITVDGKKYPAFRFLIMCISAIEHPDPDKRQFQGMRDSIRLNGLQNKIKFKKGLKPFEHGNVHQRYISYVYYPAFKIDARISLLPIWSLRDEREKNAATYQEIFSRRVVNRQHYNNLYFGKTMFPAKFKPYEGEKILTDLNLQIGPVIYDCLYDENTDVPMARRYIQAEVIKGVLDLNWIDGNKQLVQEKEKRIHV